MNPDLKQVYIAIVRLYDYFRRNQNKTNRRNDFLLFCGTLRGELGAKNCWHLEICKSKFNNGWISANYYTAMKELSVALTLEAPDKKIVIQKLAEIEVLLAKKPAVNRSITESSMQIDYKSLGFDPAIKQSTVPSAPPLRKNKQTTRLMFDKLNLPSAPKNKEDLPQMTASTRAVVEPAFVSKIGALIKKIETLGLDLDGEKIDLQLYGLDEDVCPISLCIMRNPVATKAGKIYDEAFIKKHVALSKRRARDPLTNIPIDSRLIPDTARSKQIIEKLEAVLLKEQAKTNSVAHPEDLKTLLSDPPLVAPSAPVLIAIKLPAVSNDNDNLKNISALTPSC